MDVKERRIKGASERRTASGGRRRVEKKKDKKFADYTSIRSSTGIVLPEIKKIILDRQKAEKENPVIRTSKMYPSEMSRTDWCPRATYYRMSGIPEPESKSSFTLENVFAEGNNIHNKYQSWLSDTGKLWGDWKCSKCAIYVKDSLKPGDHDHGACVGTSWVSLPGYESVAMPGVLMRKFPHEWKYKEVTLKSTSLPVSGHADGALADHNILIELKSMGIGSLKFEAPKLVADHTHDINGKKVIDIDGVWKNFHRPLTAHLKQGNLYLWMAREMGLPFNKISFVYEFKSNQQAKEFTVPFDHEIVKPILATAYAIVESLERKIIPSCYKGNEGCSSCRPYERKKEE